MGYKAGESLGKTGLGNKQFSVTKNQENDSEDEVLNNASQPESVYSDFAQRQMVRTYLLLYLLLKKTKKLFSLDQSSMIPGKYLTQYASLWPRLNAGCLSFYIKV